jgi:hypothetical protein
MLFLCPYPTVALVWHQTWADDIICTRFLNWGYLRCESIWRKVAQTNYLNKFDKNKFDKNKFDKK